MLISALVIGVLGVNALAAAHARAFLQFSANGARTKNPEELSVWERAAVLLTGPNVPKPENDATPAAHGLSFERHTIAVDEQVRLGAWWIPGQPRQRPVILFHGFAAAKSQMLLEAAAFAARGHSVLLVDFRGSGESSASYTSVGYDEAHDVLATLRYATHELGVRAPVLYGRSMGAAALLRACALGLPEATAGIVLEGVFDRMLSTVAQRFASMGVPATPFAQLLVLWGGVQGGFWGFGHNPVDYARSCSVPVLMLHGERDVRATAQHARNVLSALPSDKRLVEFPGAGHESLLARDEPRWRSALDEWLASLP